MPQALTRMRTRPAVGVGTGMVWSWRTSGPPGWCMTAARIVLAIGGGCCEEVVGGGWLLLLGFA